MAKAKEYLGPLDKAKAYVKYGYGQVEGNKLSARYNGKIFASLPCQKELTVVENGMFLCYDYAKRMVTKPGSSPVIEPMLVFNEVKVYENRETDADFAMIADNYNAIVYNATADGAYKHYMPGTGANITVADGQAIKDSQRILTEYDNVTKTPDNDSKETNPYGMMNASRATEYAVNSIVPRLFKTDVGDIFTTNCINLDEKTAADLKIGVNLVVGDDGYLKPSDDVETATMVWQIIRVYTMPDLQPGVKVMRVK